jgi:hypothetical protein
MFFSRLLVLLAIPALSFSATVGCWSNDFETDTSGWFTGTNHAYGDITRVASGTNGIPAAGGGFYAQLTGAPGDEFINGVQTNTSAYTWWSGNSAIFPASGFTTSLDIFLDTNGSFPSDTRFIFSDSINDQTGNYLNEYFFIGGYYPGPNRFVIAANDSNSAQDPRTNPTNLLITDAGWYTFQYHFFNNSGNLGVDMSVLNAQGGRLQTWNITQPPLSLATQVGGNGYGWFVTESFPTLAIDNSEIFTPEPATLGLLTLGLTAFGIVIRRRR